MTSLRKMRVIANRARIRMEKKGKLKAERKIQAQKQMSQKSFRKSIKETLGFDKLIIKGRKQHGYV